MVTSRIELCYCCRIGEFDFASDVGLVLFWRRFYTVTRGLNHKVVTEGTTFCSCLFLWFFNKEHAQICSMLIVSLQVYCVWLHVYRSTGLSSLKCPSPVATVILMAYIALTMLMKFAAFILKELFRDGDIPGPWHDCFLGPAQLVEVKLVQLYSLIHPDPNKGSNTKPDIVFGEILTTTPFRYWSGQVCSLIRRAL